jgi:hypothetical protein
MVTNQVSFFIILTIFFLFIFHKFLKTNEYVICILCINNFYLLYVSLSSDLQRERENCKILK